ncbi:MAG: hypothetical protein K0Q55_1447 [Verrucomicrobia bacterium]|nr:hypothetical protein [Verrucomicrobiota bacterium]
MGRYVERAENVARLVDINLQLMLDAPAQQSAQMAKNWKPIVACFGDEDEFAKKHSKAEVQDVIEFIVFDRTHTNSVVGSLCAARENARTIREQVTSEMWEELNRAYLWCISKSARQAFERNQYDFFQRIIQTMQLFGGITNTTMLHGEAWDFIQMGKHLERADKTTRILDEEFHLMKQCSKTPGDSLLQWLAVLRMCSARQTYQRVYGAGVQPVKVAELLLLNEDLPRSVLFCLRHADESLRRISGVAPGRFSNRAEQLSGRFLSELTFSSISEIYGKGLHKAMDDFQIRFIQISADF